MKSRYTRGTNGADCTKVRRILSCRHPVVAAGRATDCANPPRRASGGGSGFRNGDTTDNLIDMAAELNAHAPAREMDILLSAGERISMSLLSMAISAQGVPAMAFTGAQAGIRTDAKYGKAQIVGMIPERIARAIRKNNVAIVAGFQGVNDADDVTTLGRGGSDTTAVALAAALHADVCEIYTDVDGLFTADPRVVPTARRLHSLDYEETLELAANGAKILHLRAVEFARRYRVPLHVRSSFSDKNGTWIARGPAPKSLQGIVLRKPRGGKKWKLQLFLVSLMTVPRTN